MHIDARTLDDGSAIEGDLCVVGAGAAGITLALEFDRTPLRVILLESGGFDYDDRVQDYLGGPTSGQPYYPLKSTRLSYFGGTTGHWGGFCSLFDPIDFAPRPWVPGSGWPFGLEELLPFYRRAHPWLDLGPFDYSVGYGERLDAGFTPLALPEGRVWNKVWRFSTPTRFGTSYREQVVRSRNVALYTYATAVEVVAGEAVSDIREVVVRNYTAKTHRVRARAFVLACNSIQNARLLLASNRQAPAGLGNGHDQVGRCFMEHLELKAGELWLDRPRPLKYYARNRQARLEFALTAETQAEYQVLNGTASLLPLPVAERLAPPPSTWSSDDPRRNERAWHANETQARRGSLGGLLAPDGYQQWQFQARLEQAPDPRSRITLSPERDELGVPRAALHWVLTPLERRSLRVLLEVLGRELGLAGVGRVQLLPYLREPDDAPWPSFAAGGWHHLGGTRMSSDPRLGVVDPDCRVHGLANLYVAGGSSFPTAGAVNPTLTIVALTIRLADHLRRTLTALS